MKKQYVQINGELISRYVDAAGVDLGVFHQCQQNASVPGLELSPCHQFHDVLQVFELKHHEPRCLGTVHVVVA
jgi:hypothetical protein